MGAEVWHEATHSNNFLLDHPFEISSFPQLHNRVHWRDARFNSIINKLQRIDDESGEQELLGELVYGLLDERIKKSKDSSRLKAAKLATREEIERRLHLATDVMYAHFDKNLSLDDLSQASCLSKFHFVRLFKEYYHESPHQLMIRLRLEKALTYLNTSTYEVREISEKVGMANSSSFSRLFKNHFGIYPTQYAQS